MELPPTDDNGDRIIETPGVELELDGEACTLTWLNTKIRLFEDSQFNHVEVRTDNDQLVGLRVTQEFMDFLHEENYPTLSMPYIDESTFDWFTRAETKNLDQELKEL